MLILIASAKTMAATTKIKVPETTEPRFGTEATGLSLHMIQYPVEELARVLRISPKLAAENYKRFRDFHSEDIPALPAILAYTGVVFRNLQLADFTSEEFLYAQDHLRIGSGLYGTLRPLDRIRSYRMEYDVRLPELGSLRIDEYWRSRQTDLLIWDVKAAGGVLVNLAASDVMPSFDWKRVQQEVRVITPEFKVWKDGKLKAIVIYLKMARGDMARHILKNQIVDPEALKAFSWEGFTFNETLSSTDKWIFTQE
ncbi:MAG: YaaA family protein [Tannerellaceae bacterium]|nr:YaaA family protein [Tannerellaceae bacterium]